MKVIDALWTPAFSYTNCYLKKVIIKHILNLNFMNLLWIK